MSGVAVDAWEGEVMAVDREIVRADLIRAMTKVLVKATILMYL